MTGRDRQAVDGQDMEGGVWHKASVSDCLPLAAPIGLSPLLILTLCGPERVLVVSWRGGGGPGLQHRRRGGICGLFLTYLYSPLSSEQKELTTHHNKSLMYPNPEARNARMASGK